MKVQISKEVLWCSKTTLQSWTITILTIKLPLVVLMECKSKNYPKGIFFNFFEFLVGFCMKVNISILHFLVWLLLTVGAKITVLILIVALIKWLHLQGFQELQMVTSKFGKNPWHWLLKLIFMFTGTAHWICINMIILLAMNNISILMPQLLTRTI